MFARLHLPLPRAYRFVVSGGSATTAHWLLMTVLILFGLEPSIATSIGALWGAVINYLMQKRYTFRASAADRRLLPRYVTICIVLWFANLAIFLFATQLLHLPTTPAQLATTLTTALLGYWSYAWIVFDDSH